jgi:Zn-dependent M28 family amino/carboxypeptidase
MLDERGIAHQIEAFDIVDRETYPRSIGANLVVTLGEGDRDIVIGAHLDAVWLNAETLSRGAVDNAASTVILTRLAETLGGETLRHRIRIVFFDAEEIGLLGSRSYLARHEGDRIASAVNLDVNGYGDTLFYGPTAAEGNQTVHEAIAAVCAESTFACLEFPRYPQSDYASFQRAGIPNVSLSVLPLEEAEELRVAMNGTEEEIRALGGPPAILRLIHTPEDDSSHIDPAGMAIAYHAVLDLVLRLDELD